MAAADVTGDGIAELITGAGPSGGPHVRVFAVDGANLTELTGFYAYDPTYFLGGVHVAAADVTGDGIAEIITGAGPSGGPHVKVIAFDGTNLTVLASFYAYSPIFTGGVHVASADLDRIVPAYAWFPFPVGAGDSQAARSSTGRSWCRHGTRTVALYAEGTAMATLFQSQGALDVPVSAGRAPLARAGWLRPTVESACTRPDVQEHRPTPDRAQRCSFPHRGV